MTHSDSKEAAFAGLTVLDFGQYEAGSVATLQFAFLGATVIKIEVPGKGEVSRYLGQSGPSDPDSPLFLSVNASKKSVTIDMKTGGGSRLVKSLIEKADVLVQNYRPSVAARLGIAYEQVAKINPRIIYAEIRGFGSDSPYRELPAFDPIAQAMSGVTSMNGEYGGTPLRTNINTADSAAGLYAALGITTALYQRERTGKGQRIEVAMQETAIAFSRASYAIHHMFGKVERGGNSAFERFFGKGKAISSVYPCKPGGENDYCQIHFSSRNETGFDPLFKVLGKPELSEDPRFNSATARTENRAALDEIITHWTRQRTKHQVMDTLVQAGIPAGAVLSTGELLDDAYLNDCGTMFTMEHPIRGKTVLPGFPIRMSGTSVFLNPSPLLGEHTEQVLAELLGLSESEIKALKDDGAI